MDGRSDQSASDLVSLSPGVTLWSKPYGLNELKELLDNLNSSGLTEEIGTEGSL